MATASVCSTPCDGQRAKARTYCCCPSSHSPGYPLEDLALRSDFLHAAAAALTELAAASGSVTTIVGTIEAVPPRSSWDTQPRSVANAAALLCNGELRGIYDKVLLPTYGVFDEARTFAAGSEPDAVWRIGSTVAGVCVCEDIWSGDGPPEAQASAGAQVLLVLNASLFHQRKPEGRLSLAASVARRKSTRARRARPDLAGAGHRHAGLRPCRRREHGGARTIRGNRRGRDRRPSPATPSAGRASWAWRCRRPGPPPATLLAISEKLRHLALATGNKTELSIGSATLYGDMAGDFAPIKDCSKTLLYQLARHRNARGAAIPEEVLSKPPSAILRESVDLPPYAVLDSIVERYVANGEGLDEIMRSGLDRRHPWRAPADRRRRDRPAAGAARGQDQRAGIRQGSPHADQQRMAALRRRGGAAGSRQGPRAAVRPQPPM